MNKNEVLMKYSNSCKNKEKETFESFNVSKLNQSKGYIPQ